MNEGRVVRELYFVVKCNCKKPTNPQRGRNRIESEHEGRVGAKAIGI